MRSLALSLIAAIATLAGAQTPAVKTTVSVAIDSARHEVVITAGPFDLANSTMGPNMSHGMMHMAESNVMRFEWPVDGSLRGVDLVLHDARGNPIPTRILHHLVMFNFDRRGLIHSSIERLFAWGQDTQTILLPSGVAVPLPVGDHLGFMIGWHNDTGADIHDAYLRMSLTYVPPKKVKAAVYPWYLDVNNVDGGHNSFDLPAGRSTQRFSFQVPVGGRMIAVGGHMHDYAISVRLVDSASGKTLIKLKAVKDKQGNVKVDRALRLRIQRGRAPDQGAPHLYPGERLRQPHGEDDLRGWDEPAQRGLRAVGPRALAEARLERPEYHRGPEVIAAGSGLRRGGDGRRA